VDLKIIIKIFVIDHILKDTNGTAG
jgi:hypothetical protein